MPLTLENNGQVGKLPVKDNGKEFPDGKRKKESQKGKEQTTKS